VSVLKVLRNSVAGVLIAVTPVSMTLASVRPNAAVPTAGSTAVVAQDPADAPYIGGAAWAAIAVIAVTLVVAIWISVGKDKDGEGTFSRG
jgi:hypothetical protein